ncbi:response regulator [Pseudomonas rhodesiae]|jgi:DNA-binding NtrC family response regulator|uniref:response regulator n=1 Tax=unclassified Pseudomonas TaxID=196821 RepID=UPI002734F841|nr:MULTISPECIES: response regulator [unclassified Pseudomonas]WLH43254.1 response regulator [Pseudomonas sp. FP2254]
MERVVLVVEDEPVLMELAQEVLDLEGLQTIGAPNADKARLILESTSNVGLVITDIKMPGTINGFELAWLISEQWPEIPVLVTSGHQRVRADELPPNARFLPKPWLLGDFIDQSVAMLGVQP